jgi:flagellar biosynthesis/type III secretory pathway M-ring protein FliF/YscJ
MFSLPETAPWWAVAVLAALVIVMFGVRSLVRAVWPQTSAHRKEVLLERQRGRERERRRKEVERRRREALRERQREQERQNKRAAVEPRE